MTFPVPSIIIFWLSWTRHFEEGREKDFESVAINMLRSGMIVDKIKELTQLSSERIQKLPRSLTK